MKTLESYRLMRYNSIAAVLIQNRDIVANSRELSFSTSKFCKLVEIIRKKQKEFNSQLRSRQLRGLKVKDELVLIVSALASALYAFSKKTENLSLKAVSKCSQKQLFNMDYNSLIQKAWSIYWLSDRYCQELKQYGVSRNSLQFLKTKIEEFTQSFDNKRSKYFFLNHSIVKLDELFMQADEILKNIDDYVEVLSNSYSEFSRSYLNIRYTGNN